MAGRPGTCLAACRGLERSYPEHLHERRLNNVAVAKHAILVLLDDLDGSATIDTQEGAVTERMNTVIGPHIAEQLLQVGHGGQADPTGVSPAAGWAVWRFDVREAWKRAGCAS